MARRKPGPKRPSTKKEVLDRIVELALDEDNYVSKQIRTKLLEGFPESDVPALRTVQAYVTSTREQAGESVQEQPWSFAVMATGNTGIPWQAAGFLLQVLGDLRHHQKEGKHLWPRPDAPTLTVRQAKWLWRIRCVLPKVPDGLAVAMLLHYADEYAQQELLSEYLGESFDTSNLDNNLIQVLWAIDSDKDPGFRQGKDVVEKEEDEK